MVDVKCTAGRTYSFDPRHAALIIIDMQRDFIARDGTIAKCGIDVAPLLACVPRIRRVLEAMRTLGATVVHTRYGFKPDLSDLHESVRQYSVAAGAEYGKPGALGRFMTRGEPGYEIVPELAPREGEIVVDKSTFDAFNSTDIHEQLRKRGVTHVIVCGVTTQCCVEGTIRGAVDRGYYVMTLDDCCGAFAPELHEGTMRALQSEEHLYGWVGTGEALLRALPAAAAAE